MSGNAVVNQPVSHLRGPDLNIPLNRTICFVFGTMTDRIAQDGCKLSDVVDNPDLEIVVQVAGQHEHAGVESVARIFTFVAKDSPDAIHLFFRPRCTTATQVRGWLDWSGLLFRVMLLARGSLLLQAKRHSSRPQEKCNTL